MFSLLQIPANIDFSSIDLENMDPATLAELQQLQNVDINQLLDLANSPANQGIIENLMVTGGIVLALAVIALIVGEVPPKKSSTDLFVDSVKLTFTFPMFSRTNSPVVLAPVHESFSPVPLLCSVAPAPAITVPLPKSRMAIISRFIMKNFY